MRGSTTSADLQREIPAGAGSRADRIEAALETLAAEESRLGRIGLVAPRARCREQRRYWTFVRAILSLSDVPPAPRPARGIIPTTFDRSR